jgi:hypothetical protein
MGTKIFSVASLVVALGFVCAPGQVVGTYLPSGTVTGLSGLPAAEWGELRGRLLLIEFFAYW